MTTRAELYRLIDGLPDDELEHARQRLEELAAAHEVTWDEAPYDDEPETEEERAAVAEARAELARGEGIPHEDLDRILGR